MRISDWSSDVCSSDLERFTAADTAVSVVAYFGFTLHLFRSSLQPMVAGADRPNPEQSVWMGTQPLRSPGAFFVWAAARSEERRVGKESVSTWRSRWSPVH